MRRLIRIFFLVFALAWFCACVTNSKLVKNNLEGRLDNPKPLPSGAVTDPIIEQAALHSKCRVSEECKLFEFDPCEIPLSLSKSSVKFKEKLSYYKNAVDDQEEDCEGRAGTYIALCMNSTCRTLWTDNKTAKCISSKNKTVKKCLKNKSIKPVYYYYSSWE